MVKRVFLLLSAVLVLLGCFSVSAAANNEPSDQPFDRIQNKRGVLWVSAGHKYGDVTYQIGGRVNDYANGLSWDQNFPTSELKWPVNTVMAQIGGEWRLGKRWELRGSLLRNLTGNISGKMEDSDWMTNPNIPDIYSESATDFEGYSVDAGGRFWILDRRFNGNASLSLGVGAGMIYQAFKWEARHLNQWYPTNPAWGHDYVAGPVCTYRSQVWMPYAEFILKSTIDRFDFSAAVGASPYMLVRDEDNHLLRAFVSQADTKGVGLNMAMEGTYHFTPRWVAGWRFNLLLFQTKGVSETIGYAGASAADYYDIEATITSFQLDTMLTAGFRF